jgi:hypothetical protein
VVVVAIIVVLSHLDAGPLASDSSLGESPGPRPAGDLAPPAASDGPIGSQVIIEHQMIEVPMPAPPPTILRAVRPARSTSASASPHARRDPPGPFVVRARRVLVGDGRYRPEPVPRPVQK